MYGVRPAVADTNHSETVMPCEYCPKDGNEADCPLCRAGKEDLAVFALASANGERANYFRLKQQAEEVLAKLKESEDRINQSLDNLAASLFARAKAAGCVFPDESRQSAGNTGHVYYVSRGKLRRIDRVLTYRDTAKPTWFNRYEFSYVNAEQFFNLDTLQPVEANATDDTTEARPEAS